VSKNENNAKSRREQLENIPVNVQLKFLELKELKEKWNRRAESGLSGFEHLEMETEIEEAEDELRSLIRFYIELRNNDKIATTVKKAEAENKKPAPGAKPQEKEPVQATINWLKDKDRQYIKSFSAPEKPIMTNGAITDFEQSKKEWRITKTVAFIYRELCKAAEAGEIPYAKAKIPDFKINHLKLKEGGDITKDSLKQAEKRTKADKSRQNNNQFKIPSEEARKAKEKLRRVSHGTF
jgi:hypothetical protein